MDVWGWNCCRRWFFVGHGEKGKEKKGNEKEGRKEGKKEGKERKAGRKGERKTHPEHNSQLIQRQRPSNNNMPTRTLPRTALMPQLDPDSTAPVRFPDRKSKHVVGSGVVEGAGTDQVWQLEDGSYAVVVRGCSGEEAAFGDAIPDVREGCWWWGQEGEGLCR